MKKLTTLFKIMFITLTFISIMIVMISIIEIYYHGESFIISEVDKFQQSSSAINYYINFILENIIKHKNLDITLLTSTLSSFFLFSNQFKKSVRANNNKVTRGPSLVDYKKLNNSFHTSIKNEVNEIYSDLNMKDKSKFSKKDLISKMWGNPFRCSSKNEEVKIPSYILDRHIAMIGSTGVGKSTLIKHYIDYINQSNEKAIVLDINGELYSELGNKEDIVLSPFDNRSHKWDFNIEKINGEKINPSEFSKYIIPEGSNQNSFWWKGARTVFSELLNKYDNANELWNAITDPNRDFKNHLSGIVDNIIGKEGSNQDSGILGTLSADLGFLKHIINLNNFSNNDYFSITEWAMSNSSSNVYIVFSDKDFESIAPIIKIWLNLAILGRYEAGKDNNKNKMSIIADEIGDLGKLEKLPSALARLRKYNGRVIIGLQSEGQLQSIYGKDSSKAMKSNIGTRFVFRTPEEDEAKNISRFLGRSEVISFSTSNNQKDKKNYRSTTQSTSYKDIVLDSEIRSLADGHFYLKCLNLSPCKLRIQKKRWTNKNNSHQSSIINRIEEVQNLNENQEEISLY